MVMEPDHKRILQEQHVYLAENIEYGEICDYLIRDGIVSRDKHDEIQAEKGNRKQVRELLGYLPRCGPGAFHTFVNIFREIEPPRNDIADKLWPGDYDQVDGPGRNAMFEVRGTGLRQPSQHPPSPTPAARGMERGMEWEGLQGAASPGNGRLIQAHQPTQEGAADKDLIDVIMSPPPSDWFLTELTSSQRALACEDKLFARLCTKVPDIHRLALFLDFTDGERQQIQHGNQFSVHNQVLELLTRWRRRTTHPSLSVLVPALREAGVCDSSFKQHVLDFCKGKDS